MGGKLTVESQPDAGTQVTLELLLASGTGKAWNGKRKASEERR